jgi:Histidine kinase
MTLDPTLPVIADDASAGDGLGEVVLGAGGLVDDTADVRSTVVRQWLDRRALERRLHDGAALRISALSLRLGLLRHAVMRGDHEFDAALEALQDELHLVLQELRDVEGRLYPPLLDEAGLGAALREAAARCPVPVRVDAPDERFGAAAEGAAYFALLGCLPQPGRCGDGPVPLGGAVDVVVRRDGDVLVLLVTGVDACHAGRVRDEVRLLGGTVAVGVAGPAGGTGDLITVRIPCA